MVDVDVWLKKKIESEEMGIEDEDVFNWVSLSFFPKKTTDESRDNLLFFGLI